MVRHRVRTVSKPRREVIAIIDGASRGNPGPAAYGVVFKDAAGKNIKRLKDYIGETTNNVAEYEALLAALRHASACGWRRLKVRTDSELLAGQLDGRNKVRKAHLKPLHEQAQQLIAQLDSFAVEAVPRKLTSEADRLANAALDQRPVTRGPRPVTRAPREFSPAASAAGTFNVRAVYQGDVLKPRDPLALEEGEEVELEIRRHPHKRK